jgi:hypothetical protein
MDDVPLPTQDQAQSESNYKLLLHLPKSFEEWVATTTEDDINALGLNIARGVRMARRAFQTERAADVYAAMCTAADVPLVDDPALFEKLASFPTTSRYADGFERVSFIFHQCRDAFMKELLPTKDVVAEDRETFFCYEPALGTINGYHFAHDIPELFWGHQKSSVELDENDTRTGSVTMSLQNCKALDRLHCIPVGAPRHSLFAEYNNDAVYLHDPNDSSLQMSEDLFKGVLDPNDAAFPGKAPGGWCQTWSWFHMECVLMGCPEVHDALSLYFNDKDDQVLKEAIVDKGNMPPIVQEMVKAMSAGENALHHRLHLAVTIRDTGEKGRIIAILAREPELMFQVNVGGKAHEKRESELEQAIDEEHQKPGFGLALTALVRRLAARYEKLCFTQFPKRGGFEELKAATLGRARRQRSAPYRAPGREDARGPHKGMTRIMNEYKTVGVEEVDL